MTLPTIEALTRRRSRYALGRNVTLPRGEIEALVKEAVRLAPSTYNSQGSRVVILFGKHSLRFWDLTLATLRPLVPPEKIASTERRMAAFAAGIGTILFFEDAEVQRGLEMQYPAIAENFAAFSEQASGMAQLAVWMALADAGIGASLQHYNPLVDAEVAQIWDLPAHWRLRAQMPFGSIEGESGEKSFIPDDERFRSFG